MSGEEKLQILAAGFRSMEPKLDSLQPDLAAGIHLRWSFARERGFPWFGYYLFRLELGGAWSTVPSFTYPLPLPLSPDGGAYPCFGAPADENDARDLARQRVRYGVADDAVAEFSEMYQALRRLAAGSHLGGSMSDAATPEQSGAASMPEQHPLDLLLLAALHPAAAQMLGLYFIDESVDPTKLYQYLLLADHAGELALESATKGYANSALDWAKINVIRSGSHPPPDSLVDFAFSYSVGLGGDFRPVPKPGAVKAYVLPSAPPGRTDQAPPAGLTWELPNPAQEGHRIQRPLTWPVFFHLRRAFLENGSAPRPLPPDIDDIHHWKVITAEHPLLGARADSRPVNDPRPSAEWPPFPLDAIDSPGDEGWYAYHVTGVDLFGRYSASSDPAEWWQWAPPGSAALVLRLVARDGASGRRGGSPARQDASSATVDRGVDDRPS